MALHNLLTCSGWGTQVGGWIASSACMKARLGVVLLFFILAIVRKWGGEEMGIDFNLIFAVILGIGVYGIIITIFGSFGWSFMAGLIGGLIGGYGSGMFFGSEGGYE